MFTYAYQLHLLFFCTQNLNLFFILSLPHPTVILTLPSHLLFLLVVLMFNSAYLSTYTHVIMDKNTQHDDEVSFEQKIQDLRSIKEIIEQEKRRRFQVLAQEEEVRKNFTNIHCRIVA